MIWVLVVAALAAGTFALPTKMVIAPERLKGSFVRSATCEVESEMGQLHPFYSFSPPLSMSCRVAV